VVAGRLHKHGDCPRIPVSGQHSTGWRLSLLFARWAWKHPELFVGVWARPLFTVVYSLPALLGYPAAKLLTVAISAGIAWQTYRLATDLGLRFAALSIPILFAQPSFFVVSADTMTEPIFALILVVALRLESWGLKRLAMLTASFLILARPEGFFVAVLWSVWFLIDAHESRTWLRRIPWLMLLSVGSVLWWLTALLITHDPLFILHNWPSNWPVTGTIYGTGSWWNFVVRLPEIVGLLLIPCFVVGLSVSVRKQDLRQFVTLFLMFFLLHTVMRRFGLLGSAGYPRYFVAISPAIALITLVGWNRVASSCRWPVPVQLRAALMTAVFFASGVLNFAYFDGAEWIRDARAARHMHGWFQQTNLPVTRLIWSEAYMCVLFDQDPWENFSFSGERERDIEALRASSKGTLIFWEDRFGPKWHGARPADFLAAGMSWSMRRSSS
jgi:hypothetical protein